MTKAQAQVTELRSDLLTAAARFSALLLSHRSSSTSEQVKDQLPLTLLFVVWSAAVTIS